MKNVRQGLFAVVLMTASLAFGADPASEIRIGVTALPAVFDPPAETSNTGIRTLYNTFETLILADPRDGYKLKPLLATSWKRVAGNGLELKLRKGVKFHHGTEFTSKDVKFSYERVLDPKSKYTLARSMLAVISAVETPDPYTVVVRTKAPDPILELRLASNWGAQIVPFDVASSMSPEEFGRKGYGTGPYKLVTLAPDKVVLEAFADYWGPKPAAQRITHKVIPEFAGRLTALVNGEVDIITQIPPDQIATVAGYPGVDVKGVNLINMHVLYYNTGTPPLNDPLVRRALNLAIDRKLLSDSLWQGKAKVVQGHQFPEYGEYFDASRPIPEFNPAKAKDLLKKSSYKGEEILFETRAEYYTNGAQAAEAIVGMWNEVGINAKLVMTEKPTATMVTNWSNTARFTDPVGGLWVSWGLESDRQKNQWKDASARFNALGQEINSTLDVARRKAINKEMMDLFESEAPGTTLYTPYESFGVTKKVRWTPYSSQAMDFGPANFSFVR